MLKFYELAPSPNNMKVRMALRFKKIPFETIKVDFFDRQPIRDASGQDGTPVIVDKGIIINDSEAILNYLDANYPDSPRLFPRDLKARRSCDSWKLMLDKKVAKPWFSIWKYLLKWTDELDENALTDYRSALEWLDQEIGDRTSFHDDNDMAICDLRVALWAVYGLPGNGLIERVGLFKRVKQLYNVDGKSLPNLVRFLEKWNSFLE